MASPQDEATTVYTVVSNKSEYNETNPDPAILELDEHVTAVHLKGYPNLWVLQLIVKNAPNLERLRVTESSSHLLRKKHKQLLSQNGITLEFGYLSSTHAWSTERRANSWSKKWKETQRMLLSRNEKVQKRWELLQTYYPERVAAISRYYCLAGEEPKSMIALAPEFGYCNHVRLMQILHGVLKYLRPYSKANKDAKRLAKAMVSYIQRKEAEKKEAQERSAKLQKVGISRLPEGLRKDRMDVYIALLNLYNSGKLQSLAERRPRHYTLLVARYGLGSEDPVFLSFEQARKHLTKLTSTSKIPTQGSPTRARAQQMEETALLELRIYHLLPKHNKDKILKPAVHPSVPGAILHMVSSYFGREPEEFCTKKGTHHMAFHRAILIYTLHERADMTIADIANFLSGIPTTQCRSGYNKISKMVKAGVNPFDHRYAVPVHDTVRQPVFKRTEGAAYTPEFILQVACAYFKRTPEEFRSKRSHRSLVFDRSILVYTLRERAEMSFKDIERFLTPVSYQTCRTAYYRIADMINAGLDPFEHLPQRRIASQLRWKTKKPLRVTESVREPLLFRF